MIARRAKLLTVATVALLAVLALLLQWCQSTAGPKQWLVVSTPVFANRLTPTGAVPQVSLLISNVGPRTISITLTWFECRAGTWVAPLDTQPCSFPSLSPGRVSKVAWDLPEGFSVGGDALFCCEIAWWEQGSFIRRQATELENSYNPNIRPWNVDWTRPWRSKPLTNGVVFVSNLAVADYFRLVYGMDEAFESRMRESKATSTNTQHLQVFGPSPTLDQLRTNRAWSYYRNFRNSM